MARYRVSTTIWVEAEDEDAAETIVGAELEELTLSCDQPILNYDVSQAEPDPT